MQTILEPIPTTTEDRPLRRSCDTEYYLSAEEMNSMTFQVGLLGTDGVLLASDRRSVQPGGGRSISEQDKIVSVQGHPVLYAYSGDECATRAGRVLEARLGSHFDFSDPKRCLEEIGNETYSAESKRIPGFTENVNRRLIVVIYAPEIRFMELRVREASIATDVSMVVAGDAQNTARFFTEHYYERGQTVEQLKLLAVHTLRTAHLRNTMGIGADMDMFVCAGGKVDQIHDDEIRELVERSRALEQNIRDTLFLASK